MDIVWRRQRASVRDVAGALSSEGEIAYTTVMTIMFRLVKKGFLEREASGRAYVYAPLLTHEAYQAVRARTQARRFFEQFGDVAVEQFAAELEQVDPRRARRLGELLRKRQGR